MNNLTSVLNPKDYENDKHLLSIALDMAKKLKSDSGLAEEILRSAQENYKGLDGEVNEAYFEALLDDIDAKLCEIMVKLSD